MKKRLSEEQEFEIMKLVLDKFLWISFIIMGFGVYQMATNNLAAGLVWFGAGIVFLLLFIALIIKEYEIIK
jgi:heme/copper-type cytochrome/quinol oxidase subunit 3